MEIEFGGFADFGLGEEGRMDIDETSFITKIAPYTTSYLGWSTEHDSLGGISSMTAIRHMVSHQYLWGNAVESDGEKEEEEEGFIPPLHPYDNQIAHTLSRSDGLRKLLLHHVPIGITACKALASFLQNPASNLEVLSLENTKLGNGRVRILSSGLSVNEMLRELNIGCNPAITNWRAFSAALASPRCRLEKLDLSRNTIHDAAALSITNALLINTTTKLLILNSIWSIIYGITGTHPLYQMLESLSCSLEILHLNHNGFNYDMIQSLVNALANNGRLRELNLGNNWQITNVGWETFAAVFRNPNSSLEKLDLTPNEISDQAIMSFAGSLTNNITLKDLILDHNSDERHIKPVGCAAFIRMLYGDSSILSTYQSNHTLERLCYAHQEDSLPEDLLSLLQINRDNNLSQAARIKILMLSDKNLAPFFLCMKINALLYAIAWMARDDNSEIYDQSLNGMSLMFLLFRTMPTLLKRGL